MTIRDRWRVWRKSPAARRILYFVGWLIIILSPAVGILPGPGGVFVFAAGAALVLETSPRAKRWYVRAKRRWPKLGAWVDWGLRRRSERRRRARDERLAAPTTGD